LYPLLQACTIPSDSAFFKSILEVMFCEGVQHWLQFCLDQLCQNGGIFNHENKEKLQGAKSGEKGRWEMAAMLFLVKKFSGGKKSVRLRCRDATASSFVAKVWGEVFTHFQAVAIKCHSSTCN
jgi:hypothetical protein